MSAAAALTPDEPTVAPAVVVDDMPPLTSTTNPKEEKEEGGGSPKNEKGTNHDLAADRVEPDQQQQRPSRWGPRHNPRSNERQEPNDRDSSRYHQEYRRSHHDSRRHHHHHGSDRRHHRRRNHGGDDVDPYGNSRADQRPRPPPPSRLPRRPGPSLYVPPAKRRRMEQEKLQFQKSQKEQENDDDEEEEGLEPEPNEENSNGDDEGKGKKISGRIEDQRRTWQEQSRHIHGCINRLSVTNLKDRIVHLLQHVNVVRMRGCMAHSLVQAMTSTTSASYHAVYASFLAVLHSKLPTVGQVTVHRLVDQFRKAYAHKDKARVTALAMALSHLFVQAVLHELLVLQLLTLLLTGPSSSSSNTGPTHDSLSVAITILEIVGGTLRQVSPAGHRAILDQLRALLASQRELHPQVQQALQDLLASQQQQRNHDTDSPAVDPRLDLVELEDQITLTDLDLDQPELDTCYELDHFQYDPHHVQHEREWLAIQRELLGLDSDDDDDDDDGEEEEDSADEDDENQADNEKEVPESGTGESSHPPGSGGHAVVQVQDLTEADLVHLRRTIYLTIMSSATFEECAHKLASIDIPEGREEELVNMLLECCAQERTFLRYYGMIGARFCLLHNRWKSAFEQAFAQQYNTIHRLETNKLRNVAKLFAHLLYTHSLPWSVLQTIRMTEDATTSSSRIFCKILLQEMAQALGMAELKRQFHLDEDNETRDGSKKNRTTNTKTNQPEEPDYVQWFQGLFPMQGNLRETRYAINFLTSIGLGPLTDSMRVFLKQAPSLLQQQQLRQQEEQDKQDEDDDASSVLSSSSNSSSGSSSRSSSSSSSLSSSSSSSSSEDRDRRRRRGRRPSSKRRRSHETRRRKERTRRSSSVSSRNSNERRDHRDDLSRDSERGRHRSNRNMDDSSDKERRPQRRYDRRAEDKETHSEEKHEVQEDRRPRENESNHDGEASSDEAARRRHDEYGRRQRRESDSENHDERIRNRHRDEGDNLDNDRGVKDDDSGDKNDRHKSRFNSNREKYGRDKDRERVGKDHASEDQQTRHRSRYASDREEEEVSGKDRRRRDKDRRRDIKERRSGRKDNYDEESDSETGRRRHIKESRRDDDEKESSHDRRRESDDDGPVKDGDKKERYPRRSRNREDDSYSDPDTDDRRKHRGRENLKESAHDRRDKRRDKRTHTDTNSENEDDNHARRSRRRRRDDSSDEDSRQDRGGGGSRRSRSRSRYDSEEDEK